MHTNSFLVRPSSCGEPKEWFELKTIVVSVKSVHPSYIQTPWIIRSSFSMRMSYADASGNDSNVVKHGVDIAQLSVWHLAHPET
ncbi:hypothetical protein CTI12_AA475670 [Artemisia annua]|uniref:Uncharacterized protein n=1 Tax=Artemisia annua TaxID=35608 RepID=A0A2U1LME3_ARTAN|nr:hypothetical protein CTI12_AA475670 [Artemisia annua]